MHIFPDNIVWYELKFVKAIKNQTINYMESVKYVQGIFILTDIYYQIELTESLID